jgi:hypothetical protein
MIGNNYCVTSCSKAICMRGFLFVVIGLLCAGPIVSVHIRRFPPKAQHVCDPWEMVESGADDKRPPPSA